MKLFIPPWVNFIYCVVCFQDTVLQKKSGRLRDIIECSMPLLADLVTSKILSLEEECEIVTEKNQFKQNGILLNILKRKSPEEFQEFVKVLKNNDQKHVANFLKDDYRKPG